MLLLHAVLVGVRMNLINLLAKESLHLQKKKSEICKACTRVEVRASSIQCWKERWKTNVRRRLTARLMSQLGTSPISIGLSINNERSTIT